MNIQFKIRTDKPENSDGFPIYMTLYYMHQRYLYSTQCRSKTSDWDSVKGLPKKKHPFHEQIKQRIDNLQDRTKRLFMVRAPFGFPSNEQLRSYLDGVDVHGMALLLSKFVEYPGMFFQAADSLRDFLTLHLIDVLQFDSHNYQAYEKTIRLQYDITIAEALLSYTLQLLEGIETFVSTPIPCLHSAPQYDFFEEYDRFMADGILMGKKDGTMRPYRALLKLLKKFDEIKPGTLIISEYTASVHQSFLRYLMSLRDYHPNYISGICKNLTAFFNWCIKQGYPLHKQHAKISQKYIEPPRCVLTMEEVTQIMGVNVFRYNDYVAALNPEDRLGIPMWKTVEKTRDSFVFACFTGLRYSDLSRLSESHIVDGKDYDLIILHPTKAVTTRSVKIKKVVIPLTDIPQSIRNKYKNRHSTIVPVPAASYYNSSLKILATIAGLKGSFETIEYERNTPKIVNVPKVEAITSHVARHTFATLLAGLNIPQKFIQDTLGHSDQRQTAIYTHYVESEASKQIVQAFKKIASRDLSMLLINEAFKD
ncbi:site-specific integrase [Siphonobacter curvatus]|uniref:Tyr recombinase domain-containing protein n=1 Tax=Siphonobacter curvatus TaxID=2094562 RepID=A0A2S7IQF2_9BACT|nr:site-specific integrase [Siphonobacter curvatus]PQA59820.1 hypothetical protein C5O19_09420 [Siphonobacter curvatus]